MGQLNRGCAAHFEYSEIDFDSEVRHICSEILDCYFGFSEKESAVSDSKGCRSLVNFG